MGRLDKIKEFFSDKPGWKVTETTGYRKGSLRLSIKYKDFYSVFYVEEVFDHGYGERGYRFNTIKTYEDAISRKAYRLALTYPTLKWRNGGYKEAKVRVSTVDKVLPRLEEIEKAIVSRYEEKIHSVAIEKATENTVNTLTTRLIEDKAIDKGLYSNSFMGHNCSIGKNEIAVSVNIKREAGESTEDFASRASEVLGGVKETLNNCELYRC